MIPKSVIELTISLFRNELKELEFSDKLLNLNHSDKDSYRDRRIMDSIDTYKLLIKEYEKYLDENYGELGVEVNKNYMIRALVRQIQHENQKRNEGELSIRVIKQR